MHTTNTSSSSTTTANLNSASISKASSNNFEFSETAKGNVGKNLNTIFAFRLPKGLSATSQKYIEIFSTDVTNTTPNNATITSATMTTTVANAKVSKEIFRER